MPSPVGHALGSLIVGGRFTRKWLWLALIGMAPDLDLLWGRHSMETHSLGAALLAGAVAFMLASRVPRALGVRSAGWAFLVVTCVWFAHPLMDALGQDNSPPLGVMLWWPFSQRFVIAPVHIFDAISRMYWRHDFVAHNVAAVAKEILILVPLLAIVWFLTTRRRRLPSK